MWINIALEGQVHSIRTALTIGVGTPRIYRSYSLSQ